MHLLSSGNQVHRVLTPIDLIEDQWVGLQEYYRYYQYYTTDFIGS